MVPRLQRYYETLRLPTAPLAALRCLRLAIPPRAPCFAPDGFDAQPRASGSWSSGLPSRNCNGGDDRVSQVPGEPSRPLSVLCDPGRTGRVLRDQVQRDRRGPRSCPQRRLPTSLVFGAQSHGLRPGCLRFAVRITPPHARLASGYWPGSARRDWVPAGFRRKVSEFEALPPFPSFPDARSSLYIDAK